MDPGGVVLPAGGATSRARCAQDPCPRDRRGAPCYLGHAGGIARSHATSRTARARPYLRRRASTANESYRHHARNALPAPWPSVHEPKDSTLAIEDERKPELLERALDARTTPRRRRSGLLRQDR